MTDISREAVERLAEVCKSLGNIAHEQVGGSQYMRALWQAETTLLALLAKCEALEAKLAEMRSDSLFVMGFNAGFEEAEEQARVPVVKPLAEAMEDLLGEARGILPESADAFYDYKRGEFTEARILSAIDMQPITVQQAARIMRFDEPFERLLSCLRATGAEVASGQLDDALEALIAEANGQEGQQ